MTYQAPPPPPPGSYPPPGPPAGAPKPAFDLKSVDPLDLALLGVGLLTFIFSFISYFKASADFGGGVSVSDSTHAWHGVGFLAELLTLAATVVLAIALFVPTIKMPFGVRIAVLAGWALGLVFTLICLAYSPYAGGVGLDRGHGFGYWISLILVIAGTALAVMRLKATGGKLPWEQGFSIKGTPGAPPVQGGFPPPNQGYAPPPQQGYAPPPPPQNYPPQAPPPPPGSYPPPQQ